MISGSIGLIVGFALGIAAAYIFKISRVKTAKELAAELFQESEVHLKDSIGNATLAAIPKLIDLAKNQLESQTNANAQELGKTKQLIEKDVSQVSKKLDEMTKLVSELEKDRVQKFGELSSQIKTANERTADLAKTTQNLNEALANNKARGDLGEKIADDVLRVAGFIENVNYLKQKSLEGVGSRPDFTFLLPKAMKLNMDVKFPLSNYRRYVQCQIDSEKPELLAAFFKDIKARIKEVATRDYISTDENTAGYALLFIPNETTFAFIQEKNPEILDEALKSKIIFCSPMTLFAVLNVIRQAAENFALEKTSHEIVALLSEFKKQWGEYVKKMESLGDKLEKAREDFNSLMTTRRNKLERPLDKIDSLRQKGSGEPGLPLLAEFEERS